MGSNPTSDTLSLHKDMDNTNTEVITIQEWIRVLFAFFLVTIGTLIVIAGANTGFKTAYYTCSHSGEPIKVMWFQQAYARHEIKCSEHHSLLNEITKDEWEKEQNKTKVYVEKYYRFGNSYYVCLNTGKLFAKTWYQTELKIEGCKLKKIRKKEWFMLHLRQEIKYEGSEQ